MLKDIAVALTGVVAAILFEVISLGATSPSTVDELVKVPHTIQEIAQHNKIKEDVVERVLGVQLDLWLVGFSLFLGAHFNRGAKGNEFVVMVFIVLLLLIIALTVVSPHLPDWRTTFSVGLPDLLGLVALGYAVVVARST